MVTELLATWRKHVPRRWIWLVDCGFYRAIELVSTFFWSYRCCEWMRGNSWPGYCNRNKNSDLYSLVSYWQKMCWVCLVAPFQVFQRGIIAIRSPELVPSPRKQPPKSNASNATVPKVHCMRDGRNKLWYSPVIPITTPCFNFLLVKSSECLYLTSRRTNRSHRSLWIGFL